MIINSINHNYIKYDKNNIFLSFSGKRSYIVSKEQITDFINNNPDATQEEIAKGLHIGRTWLIELMKRYEIEYKNKKRGPEPSVSKETLEQTITLHPEYSLSKIGKEHGIDARTVWGLINKYGIEYTNK